MHSQHQRKRLQALILKIDLKKSYDSISWDYLKLVLLQCGFGLHTTKWIMGCVSSTTFAVLINGESSDFFISGRGLRQGCLLSPLLFTLVMEGLSLAFKNKQREGLLTGINVSRVVRILHLLFADDLLILNKASLSEWQVIKDLLTIFCSASGLQINNQKSSFYQFGVHQSALDSIKLTFNFSINNMTTGFKYLGYILKADTYRAEDWNWMLLKYENKINHWCNQWLSMGGRLVLAKAVLES